MKRPSELNRRMLQRRRVHSSWKVTLLAAVLGGVVLGSAGLISSVAVVLIVLLLLVARPVAEVYFSSQCFCPHCESDLFMEACAAEDAAGIDGGVRCPHCGEDAAHVSAQKGPVIDVEEV